jgi:MOSC domain-containing protein YiiM
MNMGANAVDLKYTLLSVNIGVVQSGIYRGKEALSGIGKERIAHKIAIGALGLEGDEQADLVHHGGVDKAICAYSHVHYPHWEGLLGRKLLPGAFGENFTLGNITENEVHIGDIFEIGTAIVQISQPRQPCWKLAMKWGLEELPLLVTESGATGFYFRVLIPGVVKEGDKLILKEAHRAGVTVSEANRVMHKDREDIEGIRGLLAVKELSASWVNTFTSRLERLSQ